MEMRQHLLMHELFETASRMFVRTAVLHITLAAFTVCSFDALSCHLMPHLTSLQW